MTDNEIIKALECCVTESGEDCGRCPYSEVIYEQGRGGCCNKLAKDALALINCQKEEIERLHIEGLQINKTFMDFVNKQIAKAIKEFVAIFKKTAIASRRDVDGNCRYEVDDNFIDNLVKEMMEGGERG